MEPIASVTHELAFEIFIADGGVDDWDEMNEAELRQIVYRELPNLLVELVVDSARAMQRDRQINS